NDMTPDDLPPPERRSFSARISEKLEPAPDPNLKIRASRSHRSMMPPGLTRSSLAERMKQAWGAGRLYESGEGVSCSVFGSTYQKPCAGPSRPYAQWRPGLTHCGEFGAAICAASMYLSSSSKASASSVEAK